MFFLIYSHSVHEMDFEKFPVVADASFFILWEHFEKHAVGTKNQTLWELFLKMSAGVVFGARTCFAKV